MSGPTASSGADFPKSANVGFKFGGKALEKPVVGFWVLLTTVDGQNPKQPLGWC